MDILIGTVSRIRAEHQEYAMEYATNIYRRALKVSPDLKKEVTLEYIKKFGSNYPIINLLLENRPDLCTQEMYEYYIRLSQRVAFTIARWMPRPATKVIANQILSLALLKDNSTLFELLIKKEYGLNENHMKYIIKHRKYSILRVLHKLMPRKLTSELYNYIDSNADNNLLIIEMLKCNLVPTENVVHNSILSGNLYQLNLFTEDMKTRKVIMSGNLILWAIECVSMPSLTLLMKQGCEIPPFEEIINKFKNLKNSNITDIMMQLLLSINDRNYNLRKEFRANLASHGQCRCVEKCSFAEEPKYYKYNYRPLVSFIGTKGDASLMSNVMDIFGPDYTERIMFHAQICLSDDEFKQLEYLRSEADAELAKKNQSKTTNTTNTSSSSSSSGSSKSNFDFLSLS